MRITLPTLPPLADVTRTIALIPELTRTTVEVVRMNHAYLLARIGGSSLLDIEDDHEDCDHDHEADAPLKPWEAGRKVIEFLMLVRSHDEFHQDFHEVMNEAAPEVDSPQHALDIVMAAVHMLAAVTDERDIEMFAQTILRAEAAHS